ncbi:hypothetical protein BHE74_00002207 [Ensete ventricosum]|nr:hypothetical protein BHE74_00002207 [Ensete ventricosum]
MEDSTVGDLYVKLVANFDLKCHTCSDLAIEEVIYATRIDENGDGLLFKKSSNFHSLRVGVAGQHVHYVKSMHQVDAVGNSLGVRRELAEGIGSLLGWRKGVRQKKTETHRKIVEGSREACFDLGIGPGLDDAVGPHREFARRFAEGIGKLSRRREITERRPDDLPQECRRFPDW